MKPETSQNLIKMKKIRQWFHCEKCLIYMTDKNWENHVNNCDVNMNSNAKTFFYIKEKVFYTNHFDVNTEIRKLNNEIKNLDNIIFVSDDIMKLCNFIVGEQVIISLVNTSINTFDPELIFIRKVWPTNEKFSNIFISEKDFRYYWKPYERKLFKIEKLPVDPEPAEEVTINLPIYKKIDKLFKSNLQKFLQLSLRGYVFNEVSYATCSFFNKDIKLHISSIKSNINKDTNLENKFSQLNTNNNKRFFKIHNETKIVIVENEDNTIKSDKNLSTIGNIWGLDDLLKDILDSINFSFGLQSFPSTRQICRGILLFGPTGCGKTMICDFIANIVKSKVVKINAFDLFSKFHGESEKNLEKQFEKAFQNYPDPTLVIIEDIHNLCPKQESSDTVNRVTAVFFNILDKLKFKKDAKNIFIVATTSDINNLNPALSQHGCFDLELEVVVPNAKSRLEIIKGYLSEIDHCLSEQQIKEIANITHGFVGSDISNLISNAVIICFKKRHNQVQLDHIDIALSQIKPSAMREISIENPNVKWGDIGGQSDLKLKLRQTIEWPLLYAEKLRTFGIEAPKGILMFGPPGCSKTMIAKALATESGLNFLSIKGPELFSMWVGESEKAVREIFRKARQVAPAIIFFDEIDAIGGERSNKSGSSVKERVLAQILTELDGITSLKNVTIVAATNRPDMIDKALMRPGRIDRIIYVGLPDAVTRKEILKIKCSKIPLAKDVNLDKLVENTAGYSGAEIQAVCQEASLRALEDNLDSEQVLWKHFEYSLNLVKPRTSKKLLNIYQNFVK